MEITIKEVEHLANLSSLNFTQEEKEKFVGDLNNILSLVNQLQDGKNLKEIGENEVYNRSRKLSELREDEPRESLPQEEILINAPKQRRGCFNVPLVVE